MNIAASPVSEAGSRTAALSSWPLRQSRSSPLWISSMRGVRRMHSPSVDCCSEQDRWRLPQRSQLTPQRPPVKGRESRSAVVAGSGVAEGHRRVDLTETAEPAHHGTTGRVEEQRVVSKLSLPDKTFLEAVLGMGGGYVLDFTNTSLAQLFDDLAIDIYEDKYAEYGVSKANRLRTLWKIGSDSEVASTLGTLADYIEAKQAAPGFSGFRERSRTTRLPGSEGSRRSLMVHRLLV